MKIVLQPQECEGNYKFDGQLVYTRGLYEEFGDDTFEIIFSAMAQIKKLVDQNIADYLQVFIIERDGHKTKIFVIDDIEVVTVLLSSDY